MRDDPIFETEAPNQSPPFSGEIYLSKIGALQDGSRLRSRREGTKRSPNLARHAAARGDGAGRLAMSSPPRLRLVDCQRQSPPIQTRVSSRLSRADGA